MEPSSPITENEPPSPPHTPPSCFSSFSSISIDSPIKDVNFNVIRKKKASLFVVEEEKGKNGSIGNFSNGSGACVKKNAFPYKTYQMIIHCNEKDPSVVSWSSCSSYFILKDTSTLEKTYIPKFYGKKSKFSSFIRQLNNYGFRNVTAEIEAEEEKGGEDWIYFRHDYFREGREDLLNKVKLPKATDKKNGDGSVSTTSSKKRKQQQPPQTHAGGTFQDNENPASQPLLNILQNRMDTLETQIKLVLHKTTVEQSNQINALQKQIESLLRLHEQKEDEMERLRRSVASLGGGIERRRHSLMLDEEEEEEEKKDVENIASTENATTARSVSPHHHHHHHHHHSHPGELLLEGGANNNQDAMNLCYYFDTDDDGNDEHIGMMTEEKEEEEEEERSKRREEKGALHLPSLLASAATLSPPRNSNCLDLLLGNNNDEIDLKLREMVEEEEDANSLSSWSSQPLDFRQMSSLSSSGMDNAFDSNDSLLGGFLLPQQQQQHQDERLQKVYSGKNNPTDERIQDLTTEPPSIMDHITSITTNYRNINHIANQDLQSWAAITPTPTPAVTSSIFSSSFDLWKIGLHFFSRTPSSTTSIEKNNHTLGIGKFASSYSSYFLSTTRSIFSSTLQIPKHFLSGENNNKMLQSKREEKRCLHDWTERWVRKKNIFPSSSPRLS